MMAEADPSGFDTIAGQPDYYIDFLDARTTIDDERRVKQVILGLLRPQDGLSVLDVGSGTGDDARELAALVARSPHNQGAAYPVVQTMQSDGVCREVLAPAPGLAAIVTLEDTHLRRLPVPLFP